MGDVSLGLIYSICIINSRFWKVLTGIDRPSRDVFVQTVPFIGLIKSAGFYIGGGGVDKLTSDERKREKGGVVQISADDVVGQSLKPESSLNGMSPSQLVSISSSSREHLKTLKSKKLTPTFTKWQRQSRANVQSPK